MSKTQRKTEKLDVVARRVKKAIDRYTSLHDVPTVLTKPRYRKVGGMRLLDQDRRLAKAAMRREFSVLARTTLVRSRGGMWRRQT
jgi:hypothetical protein